MLGSVFLQNYLFFESLSLELSDGINIFTGETGAGKSILINAIKLACGQRIKTNIFLDKSKPVNIVLQFCNLDKITQIALNDCGLDGDDDLILKRQISINNSSKYFINDVPVTQKTVASITAKLFEFTGQGSTANLRDSGYQLQLIDSNIDAKTLNSVRRAYIEYKACVNYHDTLLADSNQAARERDYLEFVQKELENLAVQENEETELLDQIKLLKRQKQCAQSFNNIDNEIETIRRALILLEKAVMQLDLPQMTLEHEKSIESLNIYLDELESAQQSVTSNFSQNLGVQSLPETEDRLYKLREYARKYAVPVHELPKFLTEITVKLQNLKNSADDIDKAKEDVKIAKAQFTSFAAVLSAKRKTVAERLQAQLNADLKQLKLIGMKIMLKIVTHSDIKASGMESVEFMVQSNVGRNFEPLANVVSGGELSRIMLAIKSNIIDDSNMIYIFDEIDTGISGAVSTRVGQKLAQIAKKHQLLVITHQPQVAVFAAEHFIVKKSANNNSTTTTIVRLANSAKIDEIARMLSGAEVTEAALEAAKALYQGS